MDASQEYDCLRKDYPFLPALGMTCKNTDMSLTWLNTWSLWKHDIDISGDVRLLIFCLLHTEIYLAWWKYSWNTLNQVNISYNNSIDKYQNISFCNTDSVILLSHEKELDVSVVVFNPFSTNIPLM